MPTVFLGWQEISKFVASDAAADDRFGSSVAIDGDTVVVAAPLDDDDGGKSGAVYVFRTRDDGATYGQVAKLTASDAASNDEFGGSVAIDGATIVAGARYDDDDGSNSGSVYVFRTSDGGATYGQVAKLTASDAASNDEFGISVAIDGATVVVGAYGDDDDGSNSGSVYVFRTSDGGATYGQVAKLTASDAASNDEFGISVAIDGDTIVAGAYMDDDGGDASGSAYVFELPTAPTPMAPLATNTTRFPSRWSAAICSTTDAIRPMARLPSGRVTTDVPTLTTMVLASLKASRGEDILPWLSAQKGPSGTLR